MTDDFVPPLPTNTDLTEYPCYGEPKKILLSWSRLSDFIACNYRTKLIHQGKKSKLSNARNFLAGKVTDLSMRQALENAEKDSEGRLLSLSLEELMTPLPAVWDNATKNLEKNTIMKWNGDPNEDQKKIINNIQLTMKNLHPILEKYLIGRRFIPEMRPTFDNMPVIGIPGPDGETCYIRLFLAVDCAVQLEEDPNNPKGVGKWGIYDLKTTSTKEYINKSLPQLVFYDLAFRALTGYQPVDHALWAPLLKPAVQQIHVTDAHRQQMYSWITAYCHGVWAGKDGFTNDPSNCYTCPTKAACPKIVGPISKDEQGISRVYFGLNDGGKLHG